MVCSICFYNRIDISIIIAFYFLHIIIIILIWIFVQIFKIVGSTEADVLNNKISNESPVGAALMGSKAGETVTVEVPNGTLQFEIMDINLDEE